jgi:hypothetical protein
MEDGLLELFVCYNVQESERRYQSWSARLVRYENLFLSYSRVYEVS